MTAHGRAGCRAAPLQGDEPWETQKLVAAIIIGGIAGWLAEQFMKSDTGLLMNIALGVVGAAIASAIFSFFGADGSAT